MIPKYWLITNAYGRQRIAMAHCPFCHYDLRGDGEWLVCLTCEVDFSWHDTDGFHIKFDRTIKTWETALNLYPEANKTILTTYDSRQLSSDDLLEHNSTRVEIAYCMTNITPQNVVEKVKLIMV